MMLHNEVTDLHHKDLHRPCPKCGHDKVVWIISFYYCDVCYQRTKESVVVEETVIQEKTRKRRT